MWGIGVVSKIWCVLCFAFFCYHFNCSSLAYPFSLSLYVSLLCFIGFRKVFAYVGHCKCWPGVVVPDSDCFGPHFFGWVACCCV